MTPHNWEPDSEFNSNLRHTINYYRCTRCKITIYSSDPPIFDRNYVRIGGVGSLTISSDCDIELIQQVNNS